MGCQSKKFTMVSRARAPDFGQAGEIGGARCRRGRHWDSPGGAPWLAKCCQFALQVRKVAGAVALRATPRRHAWTPVSGRRADGIKFPHER
jgi:hypothetical protein